MGSGRRLIIMTFAPKLDFPPRICPTHSYSPLQRRVARTFWRAHEEAGCRVSASGHQKQFFSLISSAVAWRSPGGVLTKRAARGHAPPGSSSQEGMATPRSVDVHQIPFPAHFVRSWNVENGFPLPPPAVLH